MTQRQVVVSRPSVESALARFGGQRVLVVGDVMLDRYLWGRVSRISPEAPVPVVEVARETVRLGGAANVADNIRALGGEALLIGVVGEDGAAAELGAAMAERGLGSEGLVVDPARRTTQKTRIIAHHQQVVRADQEEVGALGPGVAAELARRIEAALGGGGVRALVISDYGKGIISGGLLAAVLPRARAAGIPVCVDPKESHFDAYRNVNVITPNLNEAGNIYGRRIGGEETLAEVGFGLLERLDCAAVLITRGEEGMSLFEPPHEHSHFPTVAQEVYDVTGAGDTVVATFAMALAAGGDYKAAAVLSNHAAGRVILELGTASTTVAALGESLARNGC